MPKKNASAIDVTAESLVITEPTPEAIEQAGIWMEGDGDDLFVVLTGMPGNFGQPLFEFMATMRQIPGRKLYLRDLRQAWYLAGVSDALPDYDAVKRFIQGRVCSQATARLITLGASAGGFAALLLGFELDADIALAFGPQTFVSEKAQKKAKEARWLEQAVRAEKLGARKAQMDLGHRLRKYKHGRTVGHAWFNSGCFLDAEHARNLSKISNVTVHIVDEPVEACTGAKCTQPCIGHDVAMTLKQRGQLLSTIQAVL